MNRGTTQHTETYPIQKNPSIQGAGFQTTKVHNAGKHLMSEEMSLTMAAAMGAADGNNER